uniref:Uncharacterized protein LOC110198811 n=1 Tax=Phascolarctos cinereus TaxID=38626 RepID=A0A6P5JCW3_PHACI|nr:uncharacterized protein LOC110198811 [Phascolarctos cinereus]
MTRRSSRKKLKRGSRSAQVGLWSQSSWSQSQGTLELHSRGGSQASSLLVLGHREALLGVEMPSSRVLHVTCSGGDGQDGRVSPSSYSSSSPDKRHPPMPPWRLPSNDWLQRLFFLTGAGFPWSWDVSVSLLGAIKMGRLPLLSRVGGVQPQLPQGGLFHMVRAGSPLLLQLRGQGGSCRPVHSRLHQGALGTLQFPGGPVCLVDKEPAIGREIIKAQLVLQEGQLSLGALLQPGLEMWPLQSLSSCLQAWRTSPTVNLLMLAFPRLPKPTLGSEWSACKEMSTLSQQGLHTR